MIHVFLCKGFHQKQLVNVCISRPLANSRPSISNLNASLMMTTKIPNNRTPLMHTQFMHHTLVCPFSSIAVCSALQAMSDMAYYSTPPTHIPPTVVTRQWTRASRAIHIHVDIHPAFPGLQLRIAILAAWHVSMVVSGRGLVREDRGLGRWGSYVPERVECGLLGLRDCDGGLCWGLRV